MMTIVRSHRMENLADALCDVLSRPPDADPVAPEWVVVPSAGMERHAAMRVAQGLGVAANLDFLFPEEAASRILDAVLGEEEDPFRPGRLAWSLLDVFPDVRDREGFSILASYLGEASSHAVTQRELSLAHRLAEVLVRYVIHRPELVLAWDQGQERHDWQAELWREVRKRVPGSHLAERVRRFLEVMAGPERRPETLPPRLCVFGVSTLPEVYLRILHAVATYVDIFLFVLVPTGEWFGDALTPKEAMRAGQTRLLSQDVHPLLRSFGKMSRDFQDLLAGAGLEAQEEDRFESPARRPTMLHLLQDDILAARLPVEPHLVSPDDRTIQVHACHGPMRQVEVLRDALLALFDEDPSLEPRDVLVMTPDIGAYAPLIEAVFGEGGDGSGFPRIPFQIADRSLARENRAAEVVSRVLDGAAGRVTASEVLDLLTLSPVARRFEMTATDLEKVRDFIRAARIHFGLDADHRVALGLPNGDEHTWRFGLDRLLLGVAMDSGDGSRMFCDVVPSDEAVSGVETLRRFVAFCEELFDLVIAAREPRTLREWVAFTDRILCRLASLEQDDGALALEARLAGRRLLDGCGGSIRPLELDAWRAVWRQATGERRGGGAFFRGGVTFAAMVPLRSIPFRVIALMGLDDGAFPRQRSHLSFDHLAREPRRGDRNPRDEDLQVFFDAILSARDHLIITVTGQGIRDNEPVPPAVPVGQLLDAIRASFQRADGRDAAEAIQTRHPLQPFSPRNYLAPHLSHDARFAAAARILAAGATTETRVRFDTPTDAPPPEPVLALQEMARFLEHPVRHLLRTLGFRPEIGEDRVEDRDSVRLDDLRHHEVGEAILQCLARDADLGALLHRLRRAGALPPGGLSVAEFAAIRAEALRVMEKARTFTSGEAREQTFALDIAGTQVTGTMDRLYPAGLVWVSFAKRQEKRLLRLWLHHLVATLALPDYPGQATLILRAGSKTLGPLGENAEAARERALTLLHDLVALYRLGRTTPLPFFPKTSWDFASTHRQKGREEALARAMDSWAEGDKADPYVRYVFEDVESPEDARAPGAPAFSELAVRVLEPILEVVHETK